MVRYPIAAPFNAYRGKSITKLMEAQEYNRIAVRVAEYINKNIEDQPNDTTHVFMSASIAHALGESSEVVHKIVFSIDCGHNGVTVYKGDHERALSGNSPD